MDTVWQSSSFLDSENKKISNEIDARGQKCTDLRLSCHEEADKLGIWLDLKDTHILINPVKLFNTLFDDYHRLYINDAVVDGTAKKVSLYIDVVKERYVYSWTMLDSESPTIGINYYKQDSYVDTLRRVITEFSELWTERKPIWYEPCDLRREAVDACVRQFEFKAVFPRYYMLLSKDVRVERFVFKAMKNEEYEIGFEGRTYSTYCTHWDTDMEYVRHQLEEYAYGGEAHVKLSFDASDTEIILERKSILDTIRNVDNGQAYTYREYVLVKIISNGFADMPTLVGYCDEKQMLTEFYEGLLQFALMQPEIGKTYGDEPCNIVAYNQIKSPILESRLKNGWVRDYSVYERRQTEIKDMLTIRPGFDYFISHLDGDVSDYDDLINLLGSQFEIKGLEEWAQEMAPIVVKAYSGEPYTKDWAEYHSRGLALARQLREILPPGYDLWYDSPAEDESDTIDKPRLII